MAATLSYPHPVLGNGDDVAIGAIQPSLFHQISDEAVRLQVSGLRTGNPSLDALLGEKRALWSIRVQCARTYFRRDFLTSEDAVEVVIDGSDLDGRVQVDILLFAVERLSDYLPVGAHPDYSGIHFDLAAGELLGVGPTFAFDVDKRFDPLRAPVASIMRIRKGEHAAGPFKLALDDDLIEIALSQDDWSRYGAVKDRVPAVLHAALVLPALAEAIRRLSEFSGRRWADRLLAIIESRQVNVADPLDAAQVLLGNPLNRAFGALSVVFDAEA